jgi:hypothetical protein
MWEIAVTCDEALEDVDAIAKHHSDNADKPRERVPNGQVMTPWGKTRQELYDEAMAEFNAAKAAGLRVDPAPWLSRIRRDRGDSDQPRPRSEGSPAD